MVRLVSSQHYLFSSNIQYSKALLTIDIMGTITPVENDPWIRNFHVTNQQQVDHLHSVFSSVLSSVRAALCTTRVMIATVTHVRTQSAAVLEIRRQEGREILKIPNRKVI